MEALAKLQDLAWTASLVGTAGIDPAYAAEVRAAVSSHGLENRIRLTGQLVGNALTDEWNRADLSVLVSRAEAFGMVVTESLARGIPVIVRAGTGAVEALGLAALPVLPGTAVVLTGSESDEPEILAAAIRNWLADAVLRADWRTAAHAARDHLPGWESTARKVAALLGVLPQMHHQA